jgi:hypothetical protein
MTASGPTIDRRRLMAIVAGLPLLGRARDAVAQPRRAASSLLFGTAEAATTGAGTTFPDGATVMVAGPEGGGTDEWGRVIAQALERAMPPGTAIRTTTTGGPDGVTGANQFGARGAPDGQTVLLVPGLAALAWLVGDPRAQFDAGQWVPVLTGVTAGVMVARVGPAGFVRGARLRLAASSPTGVELPALLGVELIGADMVPVFGLAEPEQAADALRQGAVDAVFVCGHNAPARVAALAAAGALPVFTMGARNAAGALVRDPAFPDLPNMPEMRASLTGALPEGPLYDAWGATAAASQLDFGLILPPLTPAAMVSLWRRASAQAAAAQPMQAAAAALAVRPQGSPSATAAIAADAPALLALRRWLNQRLNWRPS